MMYLALTYDHRIVDGREAVSFLRQIKDIIEDPTHRDPACPAGIRRTESMP
jgi:pyruvate/2-oxoglutarate dehydrogenase complex dihydrolipoamide acyltransferase (E2) component